VFATAKFETSALEREKNSGKHVVAANAARGFALAGGRSVIPGDALISPGIDRAVDRALRLRSAGVLVFAIGPEGVVHGDAADGAKARCFLLFTGPGPAAVVGLVEAAAGTVIRTTVGHGILAGEGNVSALAGWSQGR